MALTNFILTVAGVSAVVLLLRSDVKQSATIFRRNVKHIRKWLEEESKHHLEMASSEEKRAGGEIVYGAEECYQHSIDPLEELGFPKGVLPLQGLVECGRVRETGFVWMKQKVPYEHFFVGLNTRVSYATEVTAYVDKFTMKKITGIKSKKMFLCLPVSEMIMEEQAASKNITFKTPMGIGRSFPVTAFMT